MKILVVNNYQPGNETATYEALKLALTGHDVQIQRYKPGLKFADEDKDLVILSGGGGEGSEIHDRYKKDKLWYEDLINYIHSTEKPLLGICMGFEVIARAFGAEVKQLRLGWSRFAKLKTTPTGKRLLKTDILEQYESHEWHVPEAPRGFETLATSRTGVEFIQHQERPILAVQFHPEKGGTLQLEPLIERLMLTSVK